MDGKRRNWRSVFNIHRKGGGSKSTTSSSGKNPESFIVTENSEVSDFQFEISSASIWKKKVDEDRQKPTIDTDDRKAVSCGPSPAKVTQESEESNANSIESKTEDQVSEDSRPLWDRAYSRLQEANSDIVKEYELILAKTANIERSSSLNEAMKAVVDKRIEIVTNRQWKIRIPWRRDEIRVTELVDNIVNVVLKFRSVGSTIASIDPIHAGIPFAAVCFVLPLVTNASEERVASLEALELVGDLVDLYSEVENNAIVKADTKLTKKLAKKLENLYFEILDYLTRAACYFSRSTIKRFATEVSKREDWGEKIKVIGKADEDCRAFVNQYYQQEQRVGISDITDLIRQQKDATRELIQNINFSFRENKEIISWVSQIQVEQTHSLVREKLGSQYQNSGQWLRPHYHEWINSSETPTFGLCGSVGTGKSSLVSHVIEWHLETVQANKSDRMAYFYCSRKEGQSTNSTMVIRSLIAQLAWSPDGLEVADSVKVLYAREIKRQDMLDADLLATLVSRNERTVVIIDALDECEDHSKLLFMLKKIFNDTPSTRLKYFFSSRPNINLIFEFPAWKRLSLDTEKDLTLEDMDAYIRTQVLNREGRRLLNGKQPELEEKLIATLSARAHGMFRWVELQLAKFLSDNSGLSNSEDVQEAIDTLMNEVGDPDLDKVYSEIYDMNTKAESRSRAIAMSAFHWMLCSQRPLPLAELAIVAAAGQSERMKRETDEGYILKICSNFIISNASEIAQFAHLSVREYLQKRQRDGNQEFPRAKSHQVLAETCLGYLFIPILLIDTDDSLDLHDYSTIHWDSSHREVSNSRKSLHDYATLHWAFHWQEALNNRGPNSLGKLYSRFIRDTQAGTPFIIWVGNLSKSKISRRLYDMPTLKRKLLETTSPILAACVWGFIEILQDLLETPSSNFVETIEARPSGMEIASKFGQDAIVRLFLSNGVPATVECLLLAVLWGHESVVKTLLSNGVEVNDRCSEESDPAIIHAAKSGNCSMMALLLERGADMSATVSYKPYGGSMAGSTDEYTWATPIHVAAGKGNLPMVQLLLGHGASIEATPFDYGYYYASPLDWAIRYHHEEVAALLIAQQDGFHGASKSARAMQLVLHQAAFDGDDHATFRILKQGADANATDKEGQVALHKVGIYGRLEVAQTLMKFGADPRKHDTNGRTPLHEAVNSSFNDSGELVHLFLEHGAEVGARDMNQRTALHEAAKNRSTTVIELLIKRGVDMEAGDKKCSTPLHEACTHSNSEIIGLLVHKGSDISKRNEDGHTALHLVAKRAGPSEAAKFLLSQPNINPNSKDKDGNTPLSLAMHNQEGRLFGNKEEGVVQLLISHGGVDWDSKGENGFLWDAIRDQEEKLVEAILHCGKINIDETARFSNSTLLHRATSKGYEGTMNILLDAGADIEAGDSRGSTPLHIATWKNDLKLVRILLERGANIESRNDDGYTPLILAFEKALIARSYNKEEPETDLFDLLLEKGAEINACDNYGNTSLHLSTMLLNETLVRYLLEKGADTSLKSRNGTTAFHHASSSLRNSTLATLKLLIEHGSDKFAKDDEGKSPSNYVHRFMRKDLAEIFGDDYEGSDSENSSRRRRASPDSVGSPRRRRNIYASDGDENSDRVIIEGTSSDEEAISSSSDEDVNASLVVTE